MQSENQLSESFKSEAASNRTFGNSRIGTMCMKVDHYGDVQSRTVRSVLQDTRYSALAPKLKENRHQTLTFKVDSPCIHDTINVTV